MKLKIGRHPLTEDGDLQLLDDDGTDITAHLGKIDAIQIGMDPKNGTGLGLRVRCTGIEVEFMRDNLKLAVITPEDEKRMRQEAEQIAAMGAPGPLGARIAETVGAEESH